MKQHLTIDRGNSTTKLTLWRGDEPAMSLALADATTDAIINAIAGNDIDRAIMCSVVGGIEGLSNRLTGMGIALMELNGDTRLPIAIDYATPATLGADRVAAAVGAWSEHRGKDLLVVDIGTAVTYDRVDRQGHYLGGNIAPGIGMRLRALHTFTAALPQVKSQGEVKMWGDSTESAMRAGAVRGVVAEISYYRAQMPADAVVTLTGGWSADIARMLDFPTEVSQLLVSKGLNCILQYNETI